MQMLLVRSAILRDVRVLQQGLRQRLLAPPQLQGRFIASVTRPVLAAPQSKPAAPAPPLTKTAEKAQKSEEASKSDSEVSNSVENKPVDPETGGESSTNVAKAPKKKPSLWQRVKHEAAHYWNGTKLLGYEVKISTKLALKLASGRELTRREDRQLRRTVTDIVRLVPFSMFVLVPFAELLLPVALKLFPNMLPSTYESETTKKSKMKKLSATRLNLSDFIQTGVRSNKMSLPELHDPKQREEFRSFFRQVRQGDKPSRELMLNVARVFKDDLLLDNLSRSQLAALAKYMNLQPFGTTTILRYSIRHRMRLIKQDDRVLDYEGVDSLNTLELQNACQSRGFPTYGVSTGRLRENLSNWLQLRLHERVPSTLLILGSAFSYNAQHNLDSVYDGVLNVLSALPPEVYHEAELEVDHNEATNAQRLEVIKEQQELIQDEEKEEQDSGHVIGVKDNLNVDDDAGPSSGPGEPNPTESEEDAKADEAFYAKKNVQPTPSEEGAKADEAWYKEADRRKPEPTPSEEGAKADTAFYIESQTRKPDPTPSEEGSKADTAFYADAETRKPDPTPSEEGSKADTAFYADAETRKPKPTPSEDGAKADAAFYAEPKSGRKAE